MKKLYSILLLLLASSATIFAQAPPENIDVKKQEKIQSLYVAFITQKLELTAAEAQVFWPVHNEFDKEVKTVDINLPELEREQKVLDIKKRFEPRFNKILLNPKRVDKLFRLHGEFRKKLIERIRKQNPNQQRPRIRRGV